MAVRKRTWTTRDGETKSAWIVDYADNTGVRRQKSFASRGEAREFAATCTVEVRDGIHVADSASATVKVAGELWVKAVGRAGREQTTVDQYQQHLTLHIIPFLGTRRLNDISVPVLRAFEERLRDEGRSPTMVKKVVGSLGSLLADAQERGLTTRNVVRDMRGRRSGADHRAQKRAKGRLRVGVDIPAPEEIKAIVTALAGRWRPLLLTAIFTGLRASELRGLAWSSVDLERRVLTVSQRADRYNELGAPKSETGSRDVPLPPIVVNTLLEWKLVCPRRNTGTKESPILSLDLVFPSGAGKVESLGNIINRGLMPAQIAAGVTVEVAGPNGETVKVAKYSGMHALRHFYASWCINRKSDGGLELPSKVVQERLGHSSIVITMDTYGHLFPRGDDGDELAAAERSLLA